MFDNEDKDDLQTVGIFFAVLLGLGLLLRWALTSLLGFAVVACLVGYMVYLKNHPQPLYHTCSWNRMASC